MDPDSGQTKHVSLSTFLHKVSLTFLRFSRSTASMAGRRAEIEIAMRGTGGAMPQLQQTRVYGIPDPLFRSFKSCHEQVLRRRTRPARSRTSPRSAERALPPGQKLRTRRSRSGPRSDTKVQQLWKHSPVLQREFELTRTVYDATNPIANQGAN